MTKAKNSQGKSAKRRWIIYAGIGFLFGVFDFFYQELMQGLTTATFIRVILIFGIWLVPAVPIILSEAWSSNSRWKAVLACMFTWIAAVVSYYLYMGVALAFFSLATRPELHVSNSAAPEFWLNWQSVFIYDVLGGMREWAPLAVVGGFIVGWVVSTAYLAWRKRRGEKGLKRPV